MSEGRSSLESAYLATTFRVNSPHGNIDIRVGQRQPKLDALLLELGATEWAYVTAWNPGSRRLSADQNELAQARLLRLLQDRDFTFYGGEGIPDVQGWVREHSVWIARIDLEEAVEIGRQFGQNAIVGGILGRVAQMVWCDEKSGKD
jgi:Protein of unknown function (DUF3293)